MPTSAQAHSGNGKSKKNSGASALRELAVSTLSADALIELIEKLGLKDILVARLQARIANADIDGMLDDVTAYFRRNPEALVILLGAITVGVGAIVFLEQRREPDDIVFEEISPVARISNERREVRRAAGSRPGNSAGPARR
jgi:hypothetical protein